MSGNEGGLRFAFCRTLMRRPLRDASFARRGKPWVDPGIEEKETLPRPRLTREGNKGFRGTLHEKKEGY